MKKIILLLFLIVNILIFFDIREVFFYQDGVEMMNGIVGRYLHWIDIENLNNESISIETSHLMFDKFEEITQSYHVSISYSELDSHNEVVGNTIDRFVVSHRPIDEIFNLTTDQSLIFSSETDYFYTNRHDVANSVNFFLLNDQLEVNIYPIRNLGVMVGGTYSFFADSEENLNQAVQSFMSEFEDYVSRISEVELGDPFNPQQEINIFLTPIIYISTVLAFLLILLYIHIQSNKIAIHKTMGHSFLVLIKEIFIPLTVMILLTIIVTQVILFVTVIGAFNERTIPIIYSLFNATWRQIVGVIVSIVVSSLLLLFVPLFALIKNKNFTRLLMTANYLTKIILLVAILPLLSERITLMTDNMEHIQLVHHYERNGNISDYQFSPAPLPRYGADGHTTLIMTLPQSEIEEFGSNIIYEYGILYEYHNAYQILNETGAILLNTTRVFSGEPLMAVNENFIRKYDIIDLDGNIIDLTDRTEEIVNLIPEDYQGRAFVGDMYSRGEGVIYIRNEQTVFDYSLAWDFFGIVRRPYVISVETDSSFLLWSSPFRNVFFNGDFNELLQDTMFYNRIEISTVGDELARIRSRHLIQIRDHLFVIVPILSLVVLISIQYTYLYVKVYQKRIYTNQLMGHHEVRIFWQLFVELTIGVFASMSLAWYLGIDFRLLFFIILLDFIVYLGAIGWLRFWKNFRFVEHD